MCVNKIIALVIVLNLILLKQVESRNKRTTNSTKLSKTKFGGIFDESLYANASEIEIKKGFALNETRMSYIEVDLTSGEQYLHEIFEDFNHRNLSAYNYSNEINNKRRTTLYIDDRIQINSVSIEDYPENKIGMIRFLDASNVWHTCTGILIGPRDVLTAGHCLHSGGSSGDWYTKYYFFLKRISGSTWDIMYEGSSAISVYGWVTLNNWYFDYGVLKLNVVNTNKGTAYFDFFPNMDYYINYYLKMITWTGIGYPQDKTYGTLWKTQCNMDESYDQYIADYYDCILFDGNDGSPMRVGSTVYGIYSRSGTKWIGSCSGNICSGYTIDVNYHVRINEAKFNLICDMIDNANSACS